MANFGQAADDVFFIILQILQCKVVIDELYKPFGKVVFQFYSHPTYQTLLKLENQALGNRSISEVRRTVFGVKQQGDKFEFYVISQEYRT